MNDDLSSPGYGPKLPDMEPVRKYVLLGLWQAARDGASEVVLGGVDQASVEQVAIRYRVQGVWYDMAPFPVDILPDIRARLCEMSGIPQDSRFPWEGLIEGDCDGLPLRWQVAIASDVAPIRLTNLSELARVPTPEG